MPLPNGPGFKCSTTDSVFVRCTWHTILQLRVGLCFQAAAKSLNIFKTDTSTCRSFISLGLTDQPSSLQRFQAAEWLPHWQDLVWQPRAKILPTAWVRPVHKNIPWTLAVKCMEETASIGTKDTGRFTILHSVDIDREAQLCSHGKCLSLFRQSSRQRYCIVSFCFVYFKVRSAVFSQFAEPFYQVAWLYPPMRHRLGRVHKSHLK